MKPTEEAMRETLNGDSPQSLAATYEEYTQQQPTDRDLMIAAILDAMVEEGSITRSKTIKLSDISRELGVNPKVARDKMRRAAAKQKVPDSVKAAGWVFHSADKAAIIAIIKPRKET